MRVRRLLYAGLGVIVIATVGLGAIDLVFGHMATMAVVRHGGALFLPVARDSDSLSPSMRLVLAGPVPDATPGPLAWTSIGDGFEVGELPALVDGREVDRLLLARVDLKQNRVIVRNDAGGNRVVGDWREALGARLVVNGSYYAPSGLPDTPFLADGVQIGPTAYDAKQGALVVGAGGTSIVDLAHQSWQSAFAGARDALVSYPLLIAPDGVARQIKPSNWLANRTFIGMDRAGRMIFGTSKDAFFSLARLATFLRASPLDLDAALNLDGGPVSCQAIAVGTFHRHFCGDYEINDEHGSLRQLTWLYGRWALPIVVAVVPRDVGARDVGARR